MTLDQFKSLKDSYLARAKRPDGRESTRGEYIRLCLDGGVDLVTSKDLVVFDDEHQIVHAVCINEDMRSQSSFPVKIISSEYAIIQQVETIMSQQNFEDFLKEGYMKDILSDAKKEAMIKWTRNIKNQAQQPMEAEPYFNSSPKVIPKAESMIKREDHQNEAVTEVKESDTADVINDIIDNDIADKDTEESGN